MTNRANLAIPRTYQCLPNTSITSNVSPDFEPNGSTVLAFPWGGAEDYRAMFCSAWRAPAWFGSRASVCSNQLRANSRLSSCPARTPS